jgi:hypothetical protein
MVRFGGDTGMVATALRGLKGLVQDAVKPLSSALSGAFSHFVIPLDLIGAVGKLGQMFSEVSENVKQIQRLGASTGLGAEGWQKFAFTLRQTGLEAELGEHGLNHFAETIGNAKDGVQASKDLFTKWGLSIYNSSGQLKSMSVLLDDVASRSATLGSAEERAAMAQDLFSKGGAKMVEALQKWKETKGAGAAFITDAEIEQLRQANAEIDKFSNHLKVLEARFLSGGSVWLKSTWRDKVATIIAGAIGDYEGQLRIAQHVALAAQALEPYGGSSRHYGDRSTSTTQAFKPIDMEGLNALKAALQKVKELRLEALNNSLKGQDKLNSMERESARLRAQEDDPTLTDKQLSVLIERKAALDAQIQAQAELVKLEKASYQAELNKLEVTKAFQDKSKREAIMDPFTSTLEELANRARWTPGVSNGVMNTDGHWSGGWAYETAATVQRGTQQLHDYVQNWGQDQYAQDWGARLQAMKQSLADAGYIHSEHQMEEMNKGIASTAADIKELLRKAKDEGINIVPHNGA